MDRSCAVVALCTAAMLCHPLAVEAQAQDCPPGWRWEPSRDRCESPCVPSLRQQEGGDLSEVIGAAEAQQQCRALWDRAEQLAELEAHEAAAETFAELYRDHRHQCQDVEGRCMDEVLLRAGQHYRAARRFDRAIEVLSEAEVEVAAAARLAEMHHRLVVAAPEAGAIHRLRAIELYRRGLATARRRRWSGSWSRRCQRGLRQLSPSSFPVDDEITATPSYLSSRLALPSMIERR